MKDFVKENVIGVTIISSLFLVTILTGILITATGKVFILEFDGMSGSMQDSDGNYKENHIDGGKLRFYAEADH